jgi:hypothetical protein
LSPPRPFTQFLLEQRRGALHEEISAELATVVAAVMEHGKAGKLTLTLNIKPAGVEMVQIVDKLVGAPPVGEKAPSLFFVDSAGNLQRQNPRQDELPLSVANQKASGE